MRCEVEQADFTYQATLKLPLLDALATPHVYAGILQGLAAFRVTLADIKVHSSGPNPADQLLVCLVPMLNAAVRYHLDRIEVASSSASGDPLALGALVEAALAVARDASNTFSIQSHGMALAAHGRVIDGTVDAVIGAYVPKTVTGAPPLRPQGVTFRVDAPAPANLGTVALEYSLVVEGGLFLRVVSFQNGDVPVRDAFAKGMEFIRDVAKRLSCELDWAEV